MPAWLTNVLFGCWCPVQQILDEVKSKHAGLAWLGSLKFCFGSPSKLFCTGWLLRLVANGTANPINTCCQIGYIMVLIRPDGLLLIVSYLFYFAVPVSVLMGAVVSIVGRNANKLILWRKKYYCRVTYWTWVEQALRQEQNYKAQSTNVNLSSLKSIKSNPIL